MTKQYNQLNLEQRYKIEVLIGAGNTQTSVAQILGVHKSTISRELKRNVNQRGIGAKVYSAVRANQKTQDRHQCKPKYHHFIDALKAQALDWITTKRYSPELVCAQWHLDGETGVSHETIYQFIWHCKHTNQRHNQPYKNLYKYLKHGHRKRKRGNYRDSRGCIPDRTSIEKRPPIVSKRQRFGDIEVDLIVGKSHKSALLVTVDRASLHTTVTQLENKNANVIAKKIIQRLKNYPALKTMTFDNDKAFSLHMAIAKKLNLKTYFTRPYTSQDKGTIENRNGVIRRFFPKKTDFNNVTAQEIKNVENLINNRPVRKFKYKTPNQVFLQLKDKVALTG